MVSVEVVEGVMRSALNSISKKDKISLKDYVSDLSCARILGIKVVFSSIIIETIKKSLIRISTENEVDSAEINARVYAVDENGTPNIYIYNGKKPLKKIELSEIL